MKIGDLVTRKSYSQDTIFCIIDFKADEEGKCVAILKALYNHIFIVDAPVEDLVNVLVKGNL
jgi:hypothetical protein